MCFLPSILFHVHFFFFFRDDIRVSVSEEDSSLYIVGSSRPIPKDKEQNKKKAPEQDKSKVKKEGTN